MKKKQPHHVGYSVASSCTARCYFVLQEADWVHLIAVSLTEDQISGSRGSISNQRVHQNGKMYFEYNCGHQTLLKQVFYTRTADLLCSLGRNIRNDGKKVLNSIRKINNFLNTSKRVMDGNKITIKYHNHLLYSTL